MQAFQVLLTAQHDQLVPGPGGGHIDQLPVVFQPLIGARLGLVRDGCGKQHHILFIPLVRVDRSAGHICDPRFLQRLFNQLFLVYKGSDDPHGSVPVGARVLRDGSGLRGGRILQGSPGILHVQIFQGLRLPADSLDL